MGYTVEQVWNKGILVEGQDSNLWRKDECGAWIGKIYHGIRDSQYGWEIDHVKPVSNGGKDELSNCRPLQWTNNAEKQDGRLTCSVTSSGINNVRRTRVY